jgi:3-ketosteroid 9alpha-monooxygenase subunit A
MDGRVMPNQQTAPSLTQTWIFIGFADQLKNAVAKPVYFMDRDLVLWKSQSGIISLQDAFCPHMGAHLGHGKIRGELLECIFHKRTFNGEGKCQGFGKNNKSYPISITHNMIFAWFGDTPPTWEMPDFLSGFPEQPDTKWKILRSKKINYDFHPKELLDNTVDAIHFKTFHDQCISYKPIEILDSPPHQFVSKLIFLGNPQLEKLKKEFILDLVTESFGPCTLTVSSTIRVFNRVFLLKFIFLCTPVKGKNTDYTLATAVLAEHKTKRSFGRKIFDYLYNNFAFHMQVKEFVKESEQIWKHKTFLPRPDFFPKETAMEAYRQWYSQFYVDNEKHPALQNIKLEFTNPENSE